MTRKQQRKKLKGMVLSIPAPEGGCLSSLGDKELTVLAVLGGHFMQQGLSQECENVREAVKEVFKLDCCLVCATDYIATIAIASSVKAILHIATGKEPDEELVQSVFEQVLQLVHEKAAMVQDGKIPPCKENHMTD